MTQIVARATGVTRRYGDVIAVNDLTTEIPAGQFLGLLGPNGAGKSTLFSMFVGLRRDHAALWTPGRDFRRSYRGLSDHAFRPIHDRCTTTL